MPGYLFSLDSNISLANCVTTGVYSTKLSIPSNGIWGAPQEGTFADYCSMSSGDNVYFFISRKIYGIGTLVDVGGDCKYLNYPGAADPVPRTYEEVQDGLLHDFGNQSENQRFVCFFKPDPNFFMKGIDMDEVLLSNPDSFKVLRVFWKLSFIKFGDEENQAFRDILLQRNYQAVQAPDQTNTYPSNHWVVHATVEKKQPREGYRLNAAPILSSAANADGSLRHEMALEAGLIYQITAKDAETIALFGEWDYLSHQVAASPFKPVDYMDKMDVFGYRYIPNHAPTVAEYLVIELKKGVVEKDDLLQLMKYVDWVKNEYAMGDYSMIRAFMVGLDFTADCIDALQDSIERNFIHGFRPSTPMKWNHVKLVSYEYIPAAESLSFSVQADAEAPIGPNADM